MQTIELNERQLKIVEIVKAYGPITGERIAELLSVTRATLRPDLAILTMSGFLEARPRVGYKYVGRRDGIEDIERIKKKIVQEYMSIPVVVHTNANVYDAICTMFLEDVGTLFVVDENKVLVGVISRKDLLRASIRSQDFQKMPVNIIMTRMPNITYCYKTDSMAKVSKIMMDKAIDGLPVVRDTKTGLEVIGRITKTNITRLMVDIIEGRII